MKRTGGLILITVWLLSGILIQMMAAFNIGFVATGFKGNYGDAKLFGYIFSTLVVISFVVIAIISGLKKDISPIKTGIGIILLLFMAYLNDKYNLGVEYILAFPILFLINPIFVFLHAYKDSVMYMCIGIIIACIIIANLVAFAIKKNKDEKTI